MIESKKQENLIKKVIHVLLLELLFWVLICGFLFVFQLFDTDKDDSSFHFYAPDFLYAFLLCIPLLLAYFWLAHDQEKKYRFLNLNEKNPSTNSFFFRHRLYLKYFFFRTAIALCIVAAAQPILGTKTQEFEIQSYDLVLAVDVSASMNVRDMNDGLSRLEVAKRSIYQYLNQLNSERISLTVFAENAYTQLYLTKDYELCKLFVNELNTDLVSKQGSNLAAALSNALSNFDNSDSKKIILLLSDGEDHTQKMNTQLKELKDKKIELAILGLGSKQGGPVPSDSKSPELGYKIDRAGNKIISKLNQNYLKMIQKKSGGDLKITQEAYPNLSTLFSDFNSKNDTPKLKTRIDIQENYYQIPLILGVLSYLFFLFIRFFKPKLTSNSNR